ncbi:WecB/TagA/CpsF family glycosyltransferase [Novosphingobium resinovorum]|uniref:WecB/TagA/CpsF family glycosyltransferase n=1 Tax=Novosphingobium resinovorum TaxID=158500 RepID=UPI002ED07528|nr:WecB/TagA/CpsF family glycosyltransferase [Novosphingobium resinovorum]
MTTTVIDYPRTNKVDATATRTAAGVPATRVLDVPVSTVNMPVAVATILDWIANRNAQYICVRDVHGVMRAQDDPALMAIHDGAGLITPDGMPLVWTLHARGYKTADRVCGADLVAALCEGGLATGARHYFYGGKPGVAERMAAELLRRFPGMKIVGMGTPPFRALTPEEDLQATEEISAAQPDIVWVGLSTPKQEYWMRDHVGRIPGATLVGIGAAFDFYAGDVKRAPEWMHKSGLEWLHRLVSEPRRLWRRYLVMAPKFVFKVLTQR